MGLASGIRCLTDHAWPSGGVLESDEAEGYFAGTKGYTFAIAGQRMLLSVDDGVMVGVIYAVDRYDDDEVQQLRKLTFYLRSHGFRGGVMNHFDNGCAWFYEGPAAGAWFSWMGDRFVVYRQGYARRRA